MFDTTQTKTVNVIAKPSPIIVGTDMGNKLMKTANSVFNAGISRLSKRPLHFEEEITNYIHYNGRDFTVSQERGKFKRDKSQNEDYLLLTLMGIAKEIKKRNLPPNIELVLAVSLPPGPNYYDDPILLGNLRNYFLKDGGTFRFECGGVDYCVRISDVIVGPQGFCAVLTKGASFVRRREIIIIDIGGYTVDLIRLVNGVPVADQVISLPEGAIPMYQRIKLALSGRFNRKINERQIDAIINPELVALYDLGMDIDYDLDMTCSTTIREYILSKYPDSISARQLLNPTMFFNAEMQGIVEKEANAHVESLFGQIEEIGLDLMSSEVAIVGGAAILLNKQIKRYCKTFGSYTLIEDIRANARGQELFARGELAKRR